ncbi:MAG: hypothetical protein ACN4GR_13770 [Arenicellales bacterium]
MSDKSRRKLLKSIAAGSGAVIAGKSLPESWTRPVVDSVMLPAHAQTSPALPVSFFGASVIPATLASLDNQSSPFDSLVPTAHAQGGPGPNRRFAVQALLQGVDSYAVSINNLAATIQGGGDVVRSGTLNIDGTPSTLTVTDNPCPVAGARDFTNSYIRSVGDTEIDVVITNVNGTEISLVVPVGGGSMPPLQCGFPS